jgi:hypothetical protein
VEECFPSPIKNIISYVMLPMIDFTRQLCMLCGTADEDVEFYQTNEINRRLIPRTQIDDEEMMMKYQIWGKEQAKLLMDLSL